MNNPLVTVITPSYNQGKFIEETITSVLNQTYKNIEYIIIDGASTDNTIEIIMRYSGSISKIVSKRDSGQSDAINKGISLASGELITWVNSDDLLEAHAIEYAVSAFAESTSLDFVYGDVNLIDENSCHIRVLKGRQVKAPSVFYDLDLPIPQQGCMWRRHVTSSVGPLNTQWHYVLDREFFLRICLNNNVKYINQTLGSFRQHQQSKSVRMGESWIMELPAMYYALTKIPDWPFPQDDPITKKIRASAHIHASYLALYAGKVRVGINNIILACKIYPTIIFCGHIYLKPINKIKTFLQDKIQ